MRVEIVRPGLARIPTLDSQRALLLDELLDFTRMTTPAAKRDGNRRSQQSPQHSRRDRASALDRQPQGRLRSECLHDRAEFVRHSVPAWTRAGNRLLLFLQPANLAHAVCCGQARAVVIDRGPRGLCRRSIRLSAEGRAIKFDYLPAIGCDARPQLPGVPVHDLEARGHSSFERGVRVGAPGALPELPAGEPSSSRSKRVDLA